MRGRQESIGPEGPPTTARAGSWPAFVGGPSGPTLSARPATPPPILAA
ncbi:DUF6053 domain-containing protein [Lysobacter enzymogenes]